MARRNVVVGCRLALALDVPDLERAVSRRVQEKGKRGNVNLLPSQAKVINVALDDLLVRAWSQEFNRLRQTDLSMLANTAVFLPEIVRRLREEKETLAKLAPAVMQRRAEWTKIHEEQDTLFPRLRWEKEVRLSANNWF